MTLDPDEPRDKLRGGYPGTRSKPDRTVDSGDPRCPIALFTWHRPTELESARSLRALRPARLAPGHGKVVENPLDAMDRAIARGL